MDSSSSDSMLYPRYVVVDAVDLDLDLDLDQQEEMLPEIQLPDTHSDPPRAHPFDSIVLKCCILAAWFGVMLFELDLMQSIKCSKILLTTPLGRRAIHRPTATAPAPCPLSMHFSPHPPIPQTVAPPPPPHAPYHVHTLQ